MHNLFYEIYKVSQCFFNSLMPLFYVYVTISELTSLSPSMHVFITLIGHFPLSTWCLKRGSQAAYNKFQNHIHQWCARRGKAKLCILSAIARLYLRSGQVRSS